MAFVRNLKVIKKPREDPLLDIPINFPPLQNLHLELLEVKDKLKQGLPLIPRVDLKLQTKKPQPPEPKKVLPPPPPPPPKPAPVKIQNEPKEPELDEDDVDIDKLIDTDDEDISGDDEDEEKAPSGNDIENEPDFGNDIDENDIEEIEDEEPDMYAGLSPEEREVKEKEEYIWRFRILKKQYGNTANSVPIPEYNEHSDLTMMKTSYERTIRELYLDDAVDTYRTYLLGGWIAIEYVCTQLIKIDLRGFTLQQTKMAAKYDRMLIELGEKSYTRWGMNLPVELRLLGMILFQAATFFLGKIITEKFGNVGELFKGFTGQPIQEPPAPVVQQEPPARPKKMRGPRIRAEDIRNRNEQ